MVSALAGNTFPIGNIVSALAGNEFPNGNMVSALAGSESPNGNMVSALADSKFPHGKLLSAQHIDNFCIFVVPMYIKSVHSAIQERPSNNIRGYYQDNNTPIHSSDYII